MSAVHASGVGGARPNDKRRHDQTIVRLRAELRAERAARNEAERNARRFHGMLLAERIGRLPARHTHSAVTAEGADSLTADQAPVGAARPPKPNHAPMIRQRSTPAGEEGLHLATTSNGIRRSTYTGSAADATRRVTQ